MSLWEQAGLRLLHRLDPETAHGLSLRVLGSGLLPLPGRITSPRLALTLAGMALDNPVGLAAGYDKNATALAPLARAGFGFLEVGAATPRPQPGNPRPRLFRLTEDRAAINRFGFNNDGAEAIRTRLAQRPRGLPVGLNLGANKDSADRAAQEAIQHRSGEHPREREQIRGRQERTAARGRTALLKIGLERHVEDACPEPEQYERSCRRPPVAITAGVAENRPRSAGQKERGHGHEPAADRHEAQVHAAGRHPARQQASQPDSAHERDQERHDLPLRRRP